MRTIEAVVQLTAMLEAELTIDRGDDVARDAGTVGRDAMMSPGMRGLSAGNAPAGSLALSRIIHDGAAVATCWWALQTEFW